MDKSSLLKKEPIRIVILISICLLLYFFRLGYMPLDEPDEAKHAATSKTMVVSGDWVTPRYNGENFYDTPPFSTGWLPSPF